MSHFANFSYLENNQRVSVRFMLNGRTEVVVFGHDGSVARQGVDDIDPRDSHRIITDLFSVASQLPATADGELHIEVGDGEQSRRLATNPYQLTGRGLQVANIIRTIANDILAGYEHRSPLRQGGPLSRSAGVFGQLKFAAYFFGSFFLAQVAKVLLVVVGGLTSTLALSVAITLGWLLPFAVFYGIGERFGQEYRGNSEVLIAAIPATLLVIGAAYWIGWISFWGLAGVIALPVAAKMGEQTGY